MPTQLMPGERSIALVRQHWSVVAGHFLGAVVVIVVAIVLNAVLPSHIGSSLDHHRQDRDRARAHRRRRALGRAPHPPLAVRDLPPHRQAHRHGGRASSRGRPRRSRSTASRTRSSTGRSATASSAPATSRSSSAGRDGVEVLHRIPKAEAFYNELLTTMNAPPAGRRSRTAARRYLSRRLSRRGSALPPARGRRCDGAPRVAAGSTPSCDDLRGRRGSRRSGRRATSSRRPMRRCSTAFAARAARSRSRAVSLGREPRTPRGQSASAAQSLAAGDCGTRQYNPLHMLRFLTAGESHGPAADRDRRGRSGRAVARLPDATSIPTCAAGRAATGGANASRSSRTRRASSAGFEAARPSARR